MDDLQVCAERLRRGAAPDFPPDAGELAFARRLDAQDVLRPLRAEFVLPSRASLRKRALDGTLPAQDDAQQAVYFVGNSLGAQPRAVRRHVDVHLETWAALGVHGHFTDLAASPLTQWQDLAEACARVSAAIVGARPHEVVVMNALTVNLHLLLASFYRPRRDGRYKILIEARSFPSDHYAVESQVRWHGLDPAQSVVAIQPRDADGVITIESVLYAVDEHAADAALLLLPGIQYYSGQLFDMAAITAYARARGLVVGWDLAHAAGNVELALHDWGVDFACWCTYKYLNAGPGAIAAAFVHERHGGVSWSGCGWGEMGAASPLDDPRARPPFAGRPVFRPRLAGWYGGDKRVRFDMDGSRFVPTPGASGFQLSNPSALDLASLAGALSVFARVPMSILRSKSLVLTAYAVRLVADALADVSGSPPLRIITPADPRQRGAQLSLLLLRPGLFDVVARHFDDAAVVCDKRKSDVLRVAPVPLYCSFEDVWRFAQALRRALGLPAELLLSAAVVDENTIDT